MDAPELLDGARLAAANAIYATLRFVPSDPATDRTFGVSAAGELVALGRLARHADGALEIGGFWVRADHRGAGLARHVVAHVLAAAPPDEPVWCIPFTHLVAFYRSFGLEPVEPCAPEVPASIAAKVDHCRIEHGSGHYAETALLRLPR